MRNLQHQHEKGRKQIQFPKRCVLWRLEYLTMDEVQILVIPIPYTFELF
jgi:hypothetical protein